jgi:hypothetical protein
VQFKDMKVYGTPVNADLQKKAFGQFLNEIKKKGPQTLLVLETIFSNLGLAWVAVNGHVSVANRAADRLLQKARKQGVLTFTKGAWHVHMNQERT